MSTTRIVTAALVALALSAMPGCGRQDKPADPGRAAASNARVLNLYQWADYFEPGVLKEFSAETGIKVIYNTFASQEMMEAKMLTGSSGYDVVDVPSYSLDQLTKAGVFRKLERSRLPNWDNLDADLMHDLEQIDPQNQYAVGYLWGTTAIGYDARALATAVPEAPLDSWALVFDPKVMAKAQHCGVSIANYRMETIGNALIFVGADPNHATKQQLAEAEHALQRIRPYVRRIEGASQINEMAAGSLCLLITPSTNLAMARQRAKEAGVTADLRYVIPKQGAVSVVDLLAIPADAPHVAEAYEFLDFMMRPQIAARNANFTGQLPVNHEALPLLDPALRTDAMLYPDAVVRQRLKLLHSREPDQARAETQLWTRFEFQPTQ